MQRERRPIFVVETAEGRRIMRPVHSWQVDVNHDVPEQWRSEYAAHWGRLGSPGRARVYPRWFSLIRLTVDGMTLPSIYGDMWRREGRSGRTIFEITQASLTLEYQVGHR